MASKPELPTQGIQNVVVYVSNDNFAQAYTVSGQHVPQGSHAVVQNGAYPTHSVAPVAGTKCFSTVDKLKPTDYNGFYSTTSNAVISQNGFPVVDYHQNVNVLSQIKSGPDPQPPSDSGPGRPDKSRDDCCEYLEAANCVVRCDSVRSETAESSCSSLSSADEGGLVVVPQPQEMVVFDGGGVSVRHGGVVLAVTPDQQSSASVVTVSQPQTPFVNVPFGWKRLLTNGTIIYISPSNTALSSLEQVKEYLLTPGTCKCGLECPLKSDSVFNFDPKVPGKPWTLSPDTNQGDLTKLCNHKRKLPSMASSLGCKSPDPGKLPKDFNAVKKKKRKIGGPYSGVSVSQILAQREKMGLVQQQYPKEIQNQIQPQLWPQSPVNMNHPQQPQQPRLQHTYQPDNQQFLRYQNHENQDGQINRVMSDSPVVLSEQIMVRQPQNISNQQQQQHSMQSHPQNSNPNVHIHQQQFVAPNGQVISIQGSVPPGQVSQMLQNNVVVQQGSPQQRIYINGQPSEPSGPGRPGIQMVPISISSNRSIPQQYYQSSPQQHQQQQQQYPVLGTRPPFQPQSNYTNCGTMHHQQQQQPKVWQNRLQVPQQPPSIINQNHHHHQLHHHLQDQRVPPLHQHTPPPNVWQDDVNRKKISKVNKIVKKRPCIVDQQNGRIIEHPCTNIDVRQLQQNDHGRMVGQLQQQGNSSPSFMEDPSAYLAQQTALLNNTINRQTGANPTFSCNSPVQPTQTPSPHSMSPMNQPSGVPLPSNMPPSISSTQQPKPTNFRQNQNSNVIHIIKPQNIPSGGGQLQQQQQQQQQSAYNQSPTIAVLPQEMADSSDCGCSTDGRSTYDQHQQYGIQQQHGIKIIQNRPDSQPGTPSSSGTNDDPVTSSSTYNSERSPDSRPIQGGTVSTSNVSPQDGSPSPHTPTPGGSREGTVQHQFVFGTHNQQREATQKMVENYYDLQLPKMVVTTMASGRTVGSNTITSVLAGKANTATVSINTPSTIISGTLPTMTTKSPLEMVQSVVSSIQVPHSGQQQHQQQPKPPQTFPAGSQILVSSGGQLIMANTNQPGVMAPPPPKVVTSMPPISVSPMVTNVTAAVTQVIPAVAQQVLGQQTVLVNALPGPFVLQPGVTMTMDGMTVGQNAVQIPQLLTGNVIPSGPALLSPETKRKGKKRKIPSQTVASMLHIAAAQQNQGMVVSPQSFPQQIQMAHSPQNTTPVMQALTIVPGKAGGPPQIVMNGNGIGTQQLITNSQPQQINLLQPVNLLNGGMVQNFPTIQQFIVPNLGGMVMNADGTATILQDTSNIGMQLQLQNVNGQNVLTPVQNSNVFNGGQSILPAGMVIRTPSTSQGKIIQQQHSPGAAQFLSPNGGQFVVNGQFSGQLSPLVANQQVTFNTAPQIRPATNNIQQGQQEFIQCGQMGQTLMVPCTPAANIAVSSSNQNTTFVQQNTTIVQQQTTMVSNNQQLQNFQPTNSNNQQQNLRTTLNVDHQNFIITNDKQQPVQTLLFQRQSPQNSINYRQSVSTQTAVNQNLHSVTTTASSPPDTTTHSPMASGGQSPPTADTTTHTGSTDDGLSPAPSNSSGSCGDIVTLQQNRHQNCSMAMVHCISSSEPDSADINQSTENEWRNHVHCSTQKLEFTDISSIGQLNHSKKTNPIHMAFAESSTIATGIHVVPEELKSQETTVYSSRNFEKFVHRRKHSDTLVVMETRHPLFDEGDDEVEN
nr:methyl-CpG-binding domain protein 5-like isoform X2 [Onthophagus taurus]